MANDPKLKRVLRYLKIFLNDMRSGLRNIKTRMSEVEENDNALIVHYFLNYCVDTRAVCEGCNNCMKDSLGQFFPANYDYPVKCEECLAKLDSIIPECGECHEPMNKKEADWEFQGSFTCDVCKQPIDKETNYYINRCIKCDFDMCDKCVKECQSKCTETP